MNQHSAPSTDSEEPRRVGRPSKADERTEQILSAVERCIVRDGIEGTTLARVADEAALQRSLIHHYIGTREALLHATASRVVANIDELLFRSIPDNHDASPQEQLDHVLALLFGPAFQAPEIAYLIDELAVVGLRDDVVNRQLKDMYGGFVDALDELLDAAIPGTDPDQRRTVAHAVIGIAESAARFGEYGFDPHNYSRMHTVARQVIDGLRRD